MDVKNEVNDVEEDPLKALVVSQSELNRKELTELLRGYIGIDSETGQLMPLTDYGQLNARQKIIVTLLGVKALKALGKREKETVGPKELSEISGINPSTVRVSLSRLESGKIICSKDSEYCVPNYNFQKIRQELIKNGE